MKILTIVLLTISVLFGSVDINTAGKKELTSLHGIGAKKADAILLYRKTKCFESIVELERVKGIGKKIVSKNRENLTASECK